MSTETMIRDTIAEGRTALGIELGSTRIKAVLIDHDHRVLAVGSHTWANQLVEGYWSYSVDEVVSGLRLAYADLVQKVTERYGLRPTTYGTLGISGMMHGYLALDARNELLVPFRTWRNVTTAQAARELSSHFNVNIPQRWSIAHLHQALLDEEEHVGRVASLTTLSGYVHRLLCGCHVLGIGDASGMFPVDSTTLDWDRERIAAYDDLVTDYHLPWRLESLLPQVLPAGAPAGALTPEGALLLDPSGSLQAGIPMCPPEGDAGTGMVATNAVAPRTGNISAGTSIFAMLVLDEPLEGLYEEIDPVCTPEGSPVAMVHSNNGSSELDAWVSMFIEFSSLAGIEIAPQRVYELVYRHALEAPADADGVLAYNLLAGEPVIGLEEGRPLVAHARDARMDLASTTRAHLNAMFAPLRLGMDILRDRGVSLERLFAHGGIFTTRGVAQKVLADALRTPIAVGGTASEGGAWGIAVLARYAHVLSEAEEEHRGEGAREVSTPTLTSYLDEVVFADAQPDVVLPVEDDASAFERFLDSYRRGLDAVRALVTAL